MKRLKVMLSLLVLSGSVAFLTSSVQDFIRARTVMTMVDNNVNSTIFPDYIGLTQDGKIITRVVTQRLCPDCYTESSLVNEYTYYIDGNLVLNDSRFEFLANQSKFSDLLKQ